MSILTRIVKKLRFFVGSERDLRETAVSPSSLAEQNLPGLTTHPVFLKCGLCERKMLLEVVLIGVSHNAGFSVVCHSCLKTKGIDSDYTKAHPDASALIKEWLEGE